MLNQFSQKINGKIAVSLQIFDILLAGPERNDVPFERGNIHDFLIKADNFCLQKGISSGLTLNLSLVHRIRDASDHKTEHRRDAKIYKKSLALAFARSFPMREQID